METTHGAYMKGFSENIVKNLEESLSDIGIISTDSRYDRLFDLSSSKISKLMIISHAGTMSTLLSYLLNLPLYPWTWRKFLPRHAGHTFLRSTEISSGHFFRMKEFNNVSFMDNAELKTYWNNYTCNNLVGIMQSSKVLPELKVSNFVFFILKECV